jgi:hypothetical protein
VTTAQGQCSKGAEAGLLGAADGTKPELFPHNHV